MDLLSRSEDTTLVRRMLFASSNLPKDLPHFWDVVTTFANQGASCEMKVSSNAARMAMENMKLLHPKAFTSEVDLMKELLTVECSTTKKALGIPLVPSQIQCHSCGGRLLLKSSRPSRMMLYADSLGTVPATHFHKYCQNQGKGCKFIQFYGYCKTGTGSVHYCDNWMKLPYFISSQETGFEMKMLKQFDVELLIGQISYKQKADIYNLSKGYDTTKKKSSLIHQEKEACLRPVHGCAEN